jgi:ABC-2 type transport system ATP-binding protein
MTPVITVDRLTRKFGSFTAVDAVSFDVGEGEIFGYLGANGAGKSTTIRMLIGLLSPTSGDAVVAGHTVSRDPESVKRSIGYMSQKFSLYLDLKVEQNLAFFGGAYGLSGRKLADRSRAILERTGLLGAESTLTGDLPGGIRQRLALGCSLLHEPKIVFLDEPTAGVDPVSRRQFWALIRDLAASGTTVFVTTHYMDEAELCARVGLMVDGKLVALDTPSELARVHVPGQMLAVRGRGLLNASKALAGRPGVIDVTPFGAGLHVRLAADADASAVAPVLQAAGATEIRVDATRANLEDVFLVLAAHSEAAHA